MTILKVKNAPVKFVLVDATSNKKKSKVCSDGSVELTISREEFNLIVDFLKIMHSMLPANKDAFEFCKQLKQYHPDKKKNTVQVKFELAHNILAIYSLMPEASIYLKTIPAIYNAIASSIRMSDCKSAIRKTTNLMQILLPLEKKKEQIIYQLLFLYYGYQGIGKLFEKLRETGPIAFSPDDLVFCENVLKHRERASRATERTDNLAGRVLDVDSSNSEELYQEIFQELQRVHCGYLKNVKLLFERSPQGIRNCLSLPFGKKGKLLKKKRQSKKRSKEIKKIKRVLFEAAKQTAEIALKRQQNAMDPFFSSDECVICLQHAPVIRALPCSHVLYCRSCFDTFIDLPQLRGCRLCGANIMSLR